MVQLTAQTLRDAIGCGQDLAEQYAPHLADACELHDIKGPVRMAAFLAQIAHESGALRHTSELWGPTPAQARYEGRKDLGNTHLGDGFLYRGRGLIQITGRANYAGTAQRLGIDLLASPELLEQPRWAALSAADWWAAHGCNALADAGDFTALTRRINGGTNGLEDRLQRWARAKEALAAAQPVAPAPPQPVQTMPETVNTPPRPDAEPYTQPEKPKMAAPLPLILGLAGTLIDWFKPVIKEKVTRELDRHVGNAEISGQIATSIIETAQRVTNKPDPVDAVAAAKADPAAMAQIEESALEHLQRMAPLLEKLHAMDRERWAADEASRDAASRRAAGNPDDQDRFLTRSIVSLMVGLLIAVAVLIGVLAYLKIDSNIIAGLAALFTTLAGGVAGKFSTRFDHRYGSSSGSVAKDAVIHELRRTRPAAPV